MPLTTPRKVTGGKIFVTVLPIDLEHDAVPVEYNNPSFAKPTQMLMDVTPVQNTPNSIRHLWSPSCSPSFLG